MKTKTMKTKTDAPKIFQTIHQTIDDMDKKLKYVEEISDLGYDLSHRLKKMLNKGEIKVDWNGHHRNRKTTPKRPMEYEYAFRKDFGYEETILDDILMHFHFRHAKHKKSVKLLQYVLDNPGKKWVELNDISGLNYCYECGKIYDGFLFDGKTIKAKNRCKHPNGYPPFSVDIKISSGCMVFANGFDNMELVEMNQFYRKNMNGVLELKGEMDHYAKQNIAYGYCGNSNPTILQQGDKMIVVDGGDRVKGWKKVAGVITDLWAWTMTDLNNAIEMKEDMSRVTKVKVTPGTYRVTQKIHTIDRDVKGSIFATIELL